MHGLKILLVGGLGFIGKHIIRLLAGSNELTVLSDADAAIKNQAFVDSHPVHVEVADIRDESCVVETFLRKRPDAVIHLAAITGLIKCNQNPSLAFSTNVLGTYHVIMGCVACRSKLIFLSSREVYGESLSDRTQEDDPLVPNSVYGLTKLLGERLVQWAAQRHGLDFTILRLTNVYGPGGDQYNIQAMIRNAVSNGEIPILGGAQRMNLVFIDDVVEAIKLSLGSPESFRQIFNVGARDSISLEDLVTRLVSMIGAPTRIQRKPMREGETLNFQPSLERIEKKLGFTPQTDLDEGLAKTIKWYKERSFDS
jgi:UDP-glucose 4-epimerase